MTLGGFQLEAHPFGEENKVNRHIDTSLISVCMNEVLFSQSSQLVVRSTTINFSSAIYNSSMSVQYTCLMGKMSIKKWHIFSMIINE